MGNTEARGDRLGIHGAVWVLLALAGGRGAQDRAALRGGPEGPRPDEAEAPVRVELVGRVLDLGGLPAQGAVVVSSAGGKTVTDAAGDYRLEVDVPLEATSVQVTAVGSGGGHRLASATVPLVAGALVTRVWPFQLGGGACSPSWLPSLGGSAGADLFVNALAVFDDGSGPALYAAGDFASVNGVLTNGIAKWDGVRWSALGSGLSSPFSMDRVNALAVYDDGAGPALFVGGSFLSAGGVAASRIARWDGQGWSALGAGLSGGGSIRYVTSLVVHDDGRGPALFVGGGFTSAGGVAASNVARWDGASWSALGSGTDFAVLALTVHDDGQSPALFAGGDFVSAGGVAAQHVARWDGGAWSALGSGMDRTVRALTTYDDGSGPALFAGGDFTTAGGVAARRIARWNGASWSALAGSALFTEVRALAVHDDGSGPALFAGALSLNPSGEVIAKWNGASWSTLGSGIPGGYVSALATYDEGNGPVLFAGGAFAIAGGVGVGSLARWDGTGWSSLGRGLNASVSALAVYDDGSGAALHAGGLFTGAGGGLALRIAKWDGTSWSPLAGGMDGAVQALTVFDDGHGAALHAAGGFTRANGVVANRIAKWDGTSWSAVGSGLASDAGSSATVEALAVYDDGSGPALIAGGSFTSAGGSAALNVAKWDGTSWSSLGAGTDLAVHALAVFDDGHGAALYAGGAFSSAGGVTVRNLAKWDGASWTAVGGGVNSAVFALSAQDDGTGPALFVGGAFSSAGGLPARNVARWDGTSWSALGTGLDDDVYALTVFDDGSGPALHAGGRFTSAGGTAASRIAKWDGANWFPLGSGVIGPEWSVPSSVHALAVYDDGLGRALFAGGRFSVAIDSGDSYLAKWGCARPACFALDFESEDDFSTPLVNGQHLDVEFGERVELSSAGANAGLAVFDSTPGGPNDPSQDRDLLVDSGNVLILQTENYPPDASDVFPRPNDDDDGGTIAFDFPSAVQATSLELIDIDAGDGPSTVELLDDSGWTRSYSVPANWTGDRLVAGPGHGVLDLATLAPQPGFGSVATVTQDAGFDPLAVQRITVRLAGSGAIDDLTVCAQGLDLPRARARVRNGSGVNPVTLRPVSLPVLGRTWSVELDCTAQGPGLAVVVVRRLAQPGQRTPFGEALIDGERLHGVSRRHAGGPCQLTWPIPFDMSLVGFEAHAQGLCLGDRSATGHATERRARLTNSVDLWLGF